MFLARRYLLEEMVPELEDMEQRGYFSKREIKQIVQKRQDFEYSLKRRAALKEDYLRCGCEGGRAEGGKGLAGGRARWLASSCTVLEVWARTAPKAHQCVRAGCRYIEYESRLEELRQHRRRERGITGKKSLADYCITRRIHFIYERATRKFR